MANPTALITGASGGIGEELARVFAANGHDVVLAARSAAKLEALAAELSAKHKVRAYAVAADLTDPKAPGQLLERVAALGLTVDVLVNNAGFADFGEFHKSDLGKQLEMMQVNMVALTELSHRVLPGMVARRKGRILNVGSTGSFMPGPLMSVYYATKAFVLSVSEAWQEELKGTGVSVTALCPGPVATGFQKAAAMEGSRLLSNPMNPMMPVGVVAKEGYDALMAGKTIVIPGLMNRVLAVTPRLLPRRFVPAIVKQASVREH
ncbi:MAG: SDR family oxidoreductase [Meiothermus sp.]|nr:SDR family oxidoreductase [Meiothermus sp.]